MRWAEKGYFEAVPIKEDVSEAADKVCPFQNSADNETVLAEERFADAPHRHPDLGLYRELVAGHVIAEDYRDQASSGGLTSWIAVKLLECNDIDGVIHVAPAKSGSQLFNYTISRTKSEIRAAAKSRYYSTSFAEVMKSIRSCDGKFAVIGVPCFVKAARLLAKHDADFSLRLAYFISIFCGHMKSAFFAEMLGWDLGIPPDRIAYVDFRTKREAGSANQYRITVLDLDGNARAASALSMFGTDWGAGLFKLKACDFCDDVAGETADIAVGDAWIPGFVEDAAGNNVAVIRHPRLAKLIRSGRIAGELAISEVTTKQVVFSQAASLRHRRGGLSYRLAKEQRNGLWTPIKRIQPDPKGLIGRAQLTMDARLALRDCSPSIFIQAKQSGEFNHFVRGIRPLLIAYARCHGSLIKYLTREALRLVRQLKRI
jgi:coenzyme F420 hydrogenase subunit beta